MSKQQSSTFDAELYLKDAGLVAADLGATQVNGADAVIELGAGRAHGILVLNVTACEVDTGDEVYKVCQLFSDNEDFSSGVVAGPVMYLGDAAGIAAILDAAAVPPDTDNGVGRYEIPFTNVFAGTTYKYMKLAVEVSGTIATGINFLAYVTKPTQP